MGKCLDEIETEELQQCVYHRISGCTFWFAALQIRWKTIQLAESYMTREVKFCVSSVSLGSHKKTRKLLGCNVNLDYLSKPIAACSSNSEEKLCCVCCQHIYLTMSKWYCNLLYGCVSQGLGTTESTNLIG